MRMSRRHLSHLEDLLNNTQDAVRAEIAQNLADPVNQTTRKQAELLTLAAMVTLRNFVKANTPDACSLPDAFEWTFHNTFFRAVMMEHRGNPFAPDALDEYWCARNILIESAKTEWRTEL